jgi:hypothetical protein
MELYYFIPFITDIYWSRTISQLLTVDVCGLGECDIDFFIFRYCFQITII